MSTSNFTPPPVGLYALNASTNQWVPSTNFGQVGVGGSPGVVAYTSLTGLTATVNNNNWVTNAPAGLYRMTHYLCPHVNTGTAGTLSSYFDGNNPQYGAFSSIVVSTGVTGINPATSGQFVSLIAGGSSYGYATLFSGITGPLVYDLVILVERLA